MNTNDAATMARDLIKEHLPGSDWRFGFDNAKRRFGRTSYAKRLISLSRQLVKLNEPERVRNTILHEIAHAKVGQDHGHDATWKLAAVQVGADPRRTYDTNEVEMVPAPWIGTCPNGHISRRYRMTDKARRVACHICCQEFNGGRFSADYKYTWTRAA